MLAIGILLRGLTGGATSADAWINAVKATGGTVPSAVKNAVAACLDDPIFAAKVIDFAVFCGVSNLAGALVPVISSGALSAWPSSGLVADDYIATGPDCGINAYEYVRYASIIDGPGPKVLNTGSVTMAANGGFFTVGGQGPNLSGTGWAIKNGGHPNLYQNSVTDVLATSYGFGGGEYATFNGRCVGDALVVRESSSAFRLYVNGVQATQPVGTTASTPTAGAFNLLVGVGANSLGARHTAFVVFNGATFAEAVQIRTLVMTVVAAAGYSTGITTYTVAGDSLAEGFNVPSWSEGLKTRAGRHINSALSGRLATEVVTRYANQVKIYRPDSVYSTSGWYLPLCGTNDLAAGTTGATLFTAIQAHWATAVADGWQVGKFTIPPRADTGWTGAMETQRLAFNAAVISDATAGTSLLDIAGISALSNPNDGVNYQADKLHFTAAGNVVISDYIKATLWP